MPGRKPDPTRRTVTLELDEDLVVAVQESIADRVIKAQKVGLKAATELDRDADTSDKRTGALAIFKALATAGRLAEFAAVLEQAWEAAGGTLPAGTAAAVVEEATRAVNTDEARAKTRAEVLAEIRGELDKVNGADPTDAEGLPGLDEPDDAYPAPPAQAALGDVDPAAVAAEIAKPHPSDAVVGDSDVADALAAIDGSGA